MKLKISILAFSMLAITLLASFITPYDNSKPPSISLPEAYQHASNALGAVTNQFHCISASVNTDFGPEGGWQFTFYSTNSKPKWVTVEFNGKTHVEDMMAR